MEGKEAARPTDGPETDGTTYLRRFDVLLGRFFDLSLDLLCVAGNDGYFKTINASWTSLLGYTERELLSRPYVDFVHPEDRQLTGAAATDLSGGVPVLTFENRYVARDGSYRWLAWNAIPEDGLIYAIARDVTLQKTRQQLDTARSAVTRTLARGDSWDTTVDLCMSTISRELAWPRVELWMVEGEGCRLDRVVGGPGQTAKVAAGSPLVGSAALTGEPVIIDDVTAEPAVAKVEIKRPRNLRGAVAIPVVQRGGATAVLACFSPNSSPIDRALERDLADIGILLGDHQRRLQAEAADRVEEKLARMALEYRATHDSLTGLVNRELAMDRLARALAAAGRIDVPLAVVMLDVDGFKGINDAHGHATGDAILKEVGARLQAHLRDADTVARLGGDEFVVVALLGGPGASVDRLAARILGAFPDSPQAFGGLRVRPSLGVALSGVDGTDAETLLAAADSAMYAAKLGRTGYALHEPGMAPGRAGSLRG